MNSVKNISTIKIILNSFFYTTKPRLQFFNCIYNMDPNDSNALIKAYTLYNGM